MHWTNGGATPYHMYATHGRRAYKPIGTPGVNGNYGRFKNDEATTALRRTPTPTDDAARTAALNTLQKIMVDQHADDPDLGGQRRRRVQHEELGRLAETSQPVRAGAAHPAQRAGHRPAPEAGRP